MEQFMYYNPTRVFFGKGTEALAGPEIAKFAKRVLLHYGGASAEKSGLLDKLRASLSEAGVEFVELGGVKPNPRLSLVYEGIKVCRENGVEAILAAGGGSVIDSAKAIACGAPNEGDDVWDYFLEKKTAKEILPVAAVLTIPGAGSESSDSEVITNDSTNEKLHYADERSRPVFSILNPELTESVPAYHTAAGVTDGIAHVMERYFTNTKNVDVTDRQCEGVIRTLMKYGEIVVKNPNDYDARAEVMWACKIAHDGTVGVGREEDWASHMIEHELSAKFDVSHGAGLAVVFPAWMKYVYAHDKDRFAQFAMRVLDVEYDFADPDAAVLKGIARLQAFFRRVGMPTTLGELGASQGDIDELAKQCMNHMGGQTGSFVVLKEADVREILKLAV